MHWCHQLCLLKTLFADIQQNILFKISAQQSSFNDNYFCWEAKVDDHKKYNAFREVYSQYLTVATCYQACPVHTNFEQSLIFHTTTTWGHKSLKCFPPYLLFLHTTEFSPNGLLPFFHCSGLGWFQALLNIWGLSSVDLLSLATIVIVARCSFAGSTVLLA